LVSSFTVVKYFYIPKDVPAGLLPCHITFMVKHLAFYSTEERFRTGIIIAVTFPAHTADHSVFLKGCLVFSTAILHASIRVVNDSLGWFMPPHSIFIEENKGLCHVNEDGVWRCLLVKQRGRSDGVLVMPDGRDYPKYAAYYPGEEDEL
jgi:hypothetical protein